MQAWVRAELASADLGDRRREKRLCNLVDQLSRNPEGSLNQACPTPADRKAAYRFFANERLAPEQLRKAHLTSTWRRIRSCARVLIVQDTTSLDYTTHEKARGLGPLDRPYERGFLVHSGLAVTEEGEPLGIVHQEVWAREEARLGQSQKRRERPWPSKESYKWQRTVEAVSAGGRGSKQLIIVGDRESDVYGLLSGPRPAGVELLIRSAQNRRVEQEGRCLRQALAKQPVAGKIAVEVSRAKDRQPRKALCQVRYAPLTLLPPLHADSGVRQVPVKVWVVAVQEGPAASGERRVEWILLATWPITDFREAIDCAHLYSRRWLVERYHFVLKSGCRVEQAQLRERIRLERLQAVYAIVAWRLLAMTYQARQRGASSCEPTFTGLEWQLLYAYHHGQPYPKEMAPPSIEQAVLWVAKLGGFWGRRNDGPPGVKALWRGLTRLYAMAEGFSLSPIISTARSCG